MKPSRELVLVYMATYLVCAFTPQLAAASNSDTGTLTAANGSTTTCSLPLGTGTIKPVGFSAPTFGNFGGYTPTTLTGGKTVSGVFDLSRTGSGLCLTGHSANLVITGFASDPGASWLVSITCNGVALGAGASYQWVPANSEGLWTWSSAFGFVAGSQYNCTIVHN